jgi:hypothetical protein
MEYRNVVRKGDRETDDICQNEIGGKKGEEGNKKRDAWQEIDSKEGPYREEKWYRVERVKYGTEKQEFAIGPLFQFRGVP